MSSDAAASSDPYADCLKAKAELLQANRIVASTQSYRRDNATEYAAVRAYLEGGVRPTPTTHMGIGLVALEDVCRALAPPPTTTTTTSTTTTTTQPTTTTTTTTTPPPPDCTQTIASGLQSAIQSAAPGSTICLGGTSYGNLSLNGVSKSSRVTVKPSPGAVAVIGRMNLQNVAGLTFTGDGGALSVGGLDLDTSQGTSHDLSFANVKWTSDALFFARGANQNILVDRGVFDNLGQGTYEGRITVRGFNNAQAVGITIANSHFAGGCSDGVQVIGDARGVQIGPGNEFTNIKQGSCSPVHADPIQFYGAVDTLVTGNYFHDNGDGSGGLASFDGDGPATVTNNVFVCTCQYPYSVAAWGGRNWVVQHNTFIGGQLSFRNSNSGQTPSGNIAKDNLWSGGSIQGSGFTATYNLNSGQSGTGNLTGAPVFVGGGGYAGYRLASGSPGKGAASDGSDMGIP